MKIRAVALVLAAATAVPGCQRQAEVESGQDGAEMTAPDTVTGTVRQVGSTPFVRTVLQTEDESVQVTGEYEAEIARLSGARVRVLGEAGSGDGLGPSLEVRAYRIVSVDGEEPAVGILRESETRDAEGNPRHYLEREGAENLRLRAVSGRLAGRVGAKIWVVRGENEAVQRYGLLRESRASEEVPREPGERRRDVREGDATLPEGG